MKSTKKKSSSQYTFKVDQEVVYPLQGVGLVTSIEDRVFKDDTDQAIRSPAR